MTHSTKNRVTVMALTAAIVAAFASSAFAQAWTPPKGEGSVSMLFVDTYVQDHYFATTPGDIGHIWSKTMLLDVTYGLTDKVAISFSLPWITSKYEGTFPHPITPDFSQASPLDDGRYHSAFQDLRFDIRYNVTKKGMVLTPFIGTATPSHDYGYYGHTVVGKDLNEMQVGLSGAKMLDAILPGLFVQGRYAYTIAEKVIDISHNRSNIDLETGYFITPKLRVLALGTGQVTHGGLDFSITAPLDNYALFQYHDQISRENFLTLGGGAAYSLTENFDLFSSMIHTVTARNGHAIDRGLTIGLTWSFTTNRGKDRAIASAEGALAKCVCEKRGM